MAYNGAPFADEVRFRLAWADGSTPEEGFRVEDGLGLAISEATSASERLLTATTPVGTPPGRGQRTP